MLQLNLVHPSNGLPSRPQTQPVRHVKVPRLVGNLLDYVPVVVERVQVGTIGSPEVFGIELVNAEEPILYEIIMNGCAPFCWKIYDLHSKFHHHSPKFLSEVLTFLNKL